MPTLNAYLAGASECFGGLFLQLGVASRLSAIPLIVTMLVAYATAHPDELHAFFCDPDAFVKAPVPLPDDLRHRPPLRPGPLLG
jgi:putative oxidoreductase